eukprot:scaffold3581_cov417-Prasinococcus_capsulatus_cf.AAC.13
MVDCNTAGSCYRYGKDPAEDCPRRTIPRWPPTTDHDYQIGLVQQRHLSVCQQANALGYMNGWGKVVWGWLDLVAKVNSNALGNGCTVWFEQGFFTK